MRDFRLDSFQKSAYFFLICNPTQSKISKRQALYKCMFLILCTYSNSFDINVIVKANKRYIKDECVTDFYLPQYFLLSFILVNNAKIMYTIKTNTCCLFYSILATINKKSVKFIRRCEEKLHPFYTKTFGGKI